MIYRLWFRSSRGVDSLLAAVASVSLRLGCWIVEEGLLNYVWHTFYFCFP